jgi:hypothetical protein
VISSNEQLVYRGDFVFCTTDSEIIRGRRRSLYRLAILDKMGLEEKRNDVFRWGNQPITYMASDL